MRLRILLALALLAVTTICFAIPTIAPLSLYQRINPDSSCTNYKIVSVCMKGPLRVGYLVSMNVPVAFVETVGQPGDSLLAVPNFGTLLKALVGTGLLVGQSNNSGLDNSFEAKVWELPDSVMTFSPIMPKCLICMPSDSVDPVVQTPTPTGCGALSAVSGKMTSLVNQIPSLPLMPSLRYASEADALNWRTGCGDLTLTNILQSNAFT
jgi:hypothetical protein